MTEAEILTRANRARALLEDPMIVEALATIERDVIEAFYACPVRDDEGRRILQRDLQLARQFKGVLQGAIEKGKLSANDLRERESFLKQAVSRFR